MEDGPYGRQIDTITALLSTTLSTLVTAAFAAETAEGPAASTAGTKPEGMTNRDWRPQILDLSALRQNEAKSSAYGSDFDYAKEFASLDLHAVKVDIRKVLTTSRPWLPATYGHYGPFLIRMAWHSAGTYRVIDVLIM
ncbi:hypothetical protein ACFB49_30760 [Sphingomonas sp. DBB INV C78]|uniref:hypothetical protein n=1 Tax=Sphingomonas sp. DBB INV C78 TaxID=3349434 RepID=UPI0036D43B60